MAPDASFTSGRLCHRALPEREQGYGLAYGSAGRSLAVLFMPAAEAQAASSWDCFTCSYYLLQKAEKPRRMIRRGLPWRFSSLVTRMQSPQLAAVLESTFQVSRFSTENQADSSHGTRSAYRLSSTARCAGHRFTRGHGEHSVHRVAAGWDDGRAGHPSNGMPAASATRRSAVRRSNSPSRRRASRNVAT
jgi:hypothetical protein